MSQDFDAIVIGGGIMGTSSAWWLGRRGLRVALVEKRTVGDGPTGESSAILRTHYSHELTTRMARFGLDFYRDFGEHTGTECGFHRVGMLLLGGPGDRAGIESNVALQRSLGIRAAVLDAAGVRELLPGLEVDDEVVAAWEPDSGYTDPYLAVTGLARAAREQGVELFQETAVTGFRREGERVVGVDTTAGALAASTVVDATGAWAAPLAQRLGVEAPIASCRVQIAVYRRRDELAGGHPIVADLRTACYLRPEVGDKTLVGLIDPAEAEAVVDPDDYAKKPDFSFYAEVGEKLSRTWPAMADSESAGGHASLYAITPDWHPIVDEVPAGSGHLLCSGFSGHGFKLGPAVGLMVADMVSQRAPGDAAPRFDPTAFRLDRFRAEARLGGRHRAAILG